MGSQTEFWKGKHVRDLGPTWSYPYPAWSDDSQCMLAIAETILENEPYPDTETFMESLGKNYIAYADGRWGANDRSPGSTVMGGISALRRGIPWDKSGSSSGRGDGGVMRASVVGAAYHSDPDYAFELGALTSVPTHNHLESVLASGAIAYLVACAINNISFGVALGKVFEKMQTYTNNGLTSDVDKHEGRTWVIGHLASAYAFAKGGMTPADFKSWNGNDFRGLPCLSAAIFYNAKSCRYSQVIIDCANLTGDSDSVAAVAGGLAGARFGYFWIPRRWRVKVEKSQYLHDVAKRIYEFTETINARTSLQPKVQQKVFSN